MNIFVLSKDPEECAKYHCDKHVVKMTLETAQILSGALHRYINDVPYILHTIQMPPGELSNQERMIIYERIYNDITSKIYRPTHLEHPCIKWASKHKQNFNWLCDLGLALANEYKYRWGKEHKSKEIIRNCIELNDKYNIIPEQRRGIFSEIKFEPVIAEDCKVFDNGTINTVNSYRNYYIKYKKNLSQYNKREKPDWIDNELYQRQNNQLCSPLFSEIAMRYSNSLDTSGDLDRLLNHHYTNLSDIMEERRNRYIGYITSINERNWACNIRIE